MIQGQKYCFLSPHTDIRSEMAGSLFSANYQFHVMAWHSHLLGTIMESVDFLRGAMTLGSTVSGIA